MLHEMFSIYAKFGMLAFLIVWVFGARLAWKRVEEGHGLRSNSKPLSTEGIYVLTLQGVAGADKHNEHRLDTFLAHIRSLGCFQDMHINICKGIYKSDLQPGYGTTQAYIECLDHIRKDGIAEAHIFEDDVRFYDYESCVGLRQKLHSAPKDTLLVMYGGHDWKYDMSKSVVGYTGVKRAWGAYGWGIRKEALHLVEEGFRNELVLGSANISPESSWVRVAKESGTTIYATEPLLVEHPASWSNTWRIPRRKVNESF